MTIRFNGVLAAPRSAASGLDADSVRAAYRRWAGVYDAVFGGISAAGRRQAVDAVNTLPGQDVLEVGVGTGLALPRYTAQKRVTGIDLSAEMLDRARVRAARESLSNVAGLYEMDAEATGFAEGQFDIAVAMFVASVVPDARRLLAEMRRVVRPGGHFLFVNHFAATAGVRLAVESAMAPASRALGWHPDFRFEALLPPDDSSRAIMAPVPPLRLIHVGPPVELTICRTCRRGPPLCGLPGRAIVSWCLPE